MALRTLDIADGFSSAGAPSDAETIAKIHDATGTPFSAGNRLPVDIGTVSLTVSNEVEIKNDAGNPVPVSGTVTANTGLSQPLTDAELRATAVPVSGTVTANTGLTQPLTDAELRASALPITTGAITGTITSAQKSVGLTAIRATVSGSVITSSNKVRRLKPASANAGRIWFGSSGVTTSTGMEIVGPDTINLDADYSDYYLISDTASQVVEILEVN